MFCLPKTAWPPTFFVSVGVLAVLALGLIPGNAGRVARYVGAAGTLTTFAASFQVGTTGGDMVYKYNAASAYTTPGAGGVTADGKEETAANADKKGSDEKEGNERGESGER